MLFTRQEEVPCGEYTTLGFPMFDNNASPLNSSHSINHVDLERELLELPITEQMRGLRTIYSSLPKSYTSETYYRNRVIDILSVRVDPKLVREAYGATLGGEKYSDDSDEMLVKQLMLDILTSFPDTSELFNYAIQMLDDAAREAGVM